MSPLGIQIEAACTPLGTPLRPPRRPLLRCALRAQTSDVHQRLHHHAGFTSIHNATIGRTEYRDLLARLYGFYVPFEVAAAIPPDRSRWLQQDLETLGLTRSPEALPQCPHVPRLDNANRRLGALYVAEGSALGGRDLARGLDHLVGRDNTQGRKFFIGRGAATGEAWRGYLAQLAAIPCEPAAHAEIIEAAVETFAAFEQWLTGWSNSSHG